MQGLFQSSVCAPRSGWHRCLPTAAPRRLVLCAAKKSAAAEPSKLPTTRPRKAQEATKSKPRAAAKSTRAKAAPAGKEAPAAKAATPAKKAAPAAKAAPADADDPAARTAAAAQYTGVMWRDDRKAYYCQARVSGQKIYLGVYDDPREAAIVYDTVMWRFEGGEKNPRNNPKRRLNFGEKYKKAPLDPEIEARVERAFQRGLEKRREQAETKTAKKHHELMEKARAEKARAEKARAAGTL